MKSILLEILRRGLLSEEDTLRDNRFAVLLYDHTSGWPDSKAIDTEWWNTLLKAYEDGVAGRIPEAAMSAGIKDYRLREAHICGIKGYGNPKPHFDVYGLSFGDECRSAVLLGENGVGKSSVYLGMELAMTRTSWLARYRGVNLDGENHDSESDDGSEMSAKGDYREELSRFITNIGTLRKDVSASVVLGMADAEGRPTGMVYRLAGPHSGDTVLPASFCCDYDLQHLANPGVDSDFILTQLGLRPYYAALCCMNNWLQKYSDPENKAVSGEDKNTVMEALKEYITSLSNPQTGEPVNTDELTKTILGRYIGRLSGKPEPLVVFKRYADRISSIYLGQEVDKKKDEAYNKILVDYIQDIPVLPDYPVTEIQKTFKWMVSLYESILKRMCEVVDRTLNELFEGYLDEITGFDVSLARRGNIMESIKVRVLVGEESGEGKEDYPDSNQRQLPRLYFNTFRFKLFCVTLKMALAISAAKVYGWRLPFVIDDIFESSDFSNRAGIDCYIANVLENVSVYCGKEGMQLIVFTQDDLIAEGIWKGAYRKGWPLDLWRMFGPGSVDDRERREIYGKSRTSVMDDAIRIAPVGYILK